MDIPIPPQAPMAPPPGFGGEYGPPGAIPIDDWAGPVRMASPLPYQDQYRGSSPPMIDILDDDIGVKPKQKKKDKGQKFAESVESKPVKTQFEGYMLEPAEPRSGGKRTWARVGKRILPIDDQKLVNLVKEHRLSKRSGGPAADFSRLESNQQGVINRLIEERVQEDKNSNADWVLVDVIRTGIQHLTRPMEVKKLRVILKRQDKSLTRPGEKKNLATGTAYQYAEIIDLREPLPTKKAGKEKDDKKDKKPIKRQQADEILDDPMTPVGLGVDHNQYHGHGRQQPQLPMGEPWVQAPPGPPPGAIPVPQHLHQMPPQAQMPPMFPQQMPPQPMQQPFAANPFQPYPEVMHPGQFESPLFGRNDVPATRPRVRVQTGRSPSSSPSPRASRSPRRSPSCRRSSSGKRLRQLQGEVDELRQEVRRVDDLREVRNKIENWHVSSDSSAEGDSVFSRGGSGQSFTPPSTPPLSEVPPRGSLHRRKSSERRPEYRYVPRGGRRGSRYVDERVEVRPAYPPQIRADQYSPERERPRYRQEREYARERPRYVPPPQPKLQRATTYDDYPVARVAEPRYAPSRIQRRLTNYEEGYGVADFREQYQQPRDTPRRVPVDEVQDAFEAGRREQARVARRNSANVGGGYYL